MKITLKDLRRMGACSEQVTLFKSLFGGEVEMTRENVLQYGAQFDLSWLASNIMSEAQYADYKIRRAPLDADYESKRDALFADYESKRDALSADYVSKRDALYADYESKCAPLDADYKSKRVSLFADILGL